MRKLGLVLAAVVVMQGGVFGSDDFFNTERNSDCVSVITQHIKTPETLATEVARLQQELTYMEERQSRNKTDYQSSQKAFKSLKAAWDRFIKFEGTELTITARDSFTTVQTSYYDFPADPITLHCTVEDFQEPTERKDKIFMLMCLTAEYGRRISNFEKTMEDIEDKRRELETKKDELAFARGEDSSMSKTRRG